MIEFALEGARHGKVQMMLELFQLIDTVPADYTLASVCLVDVKISSVCVFVCVCVCV